jgi:succinate dehydrogenase flavin-adding protein (antitoxin of CptAB toxin-antitoxin module)
MLTQKEIKQIEQFANELKKWADNLSYKRPSHTKVTLTPNSRWRYKKEILLLCEKTNLGAKVEKDFTELDQLHQEYESWRAKTLTEDNEENFRTLVDCLKDTLWDLADTLNQIAQMARKERNQRILKLIFYVTSAVVVFLAALLTIFHYLGWL